MKKKTIELRCGALFVKSIDAETDENVNTFGDLFLMVQIDKVRALRLTVFLDQNSFPSLIRSLLNSVES